MAELDPDETYRKLQEALAAHVAATADPELPMLTDWVIVAAQVGIDAPDHTGYKYYGSGAGPHVLEGLLRRGIRWLYADD